MFGATTGIVLLGLMQNILALASVASYWIDAIDGTVILIALIPPRIVSGDGSMNSFGASERQEYS